VADIHVCPQPGHKPTVANDRFATVRHDCARSASEAIGLRTPPPPTIDYDMAFASGVSGEPPRSCHPRHNGHGRAVAYRTWTGLTDSGVKNRLARAAKMIGVKPMAAA